MNNSTNKHYCMVCEKELDYEPQYCCSGRDCGCLGMPVDPPVCSKECYDKLLESKDKV